MEVHDGEVWSFGFKACCVRNATSEEGEPEERIGSHRQESQAGDRDRFE
jgi:hypothetical protein